MPAGGRVRPQTGEGWACEKNNLELSELNFTLLEAKPRNPLRRKEIGVWYHAPWWGRLPSGAPNLLWRKALAIFRPKKGEKSSRSWRERKVFVYFRFFSARRIVSGKENGKENGKEKEGKEKIFLKNLEKAAYK